MVGPVILTAVAVLLPGSEYEGTRSDSLAELSPVVAEIVGFTVSSGPAAAPAQSLWFSPSPDPDRAAVLFPPASPEDPWSIVPARPGSEIKVFPKADGAQRNDASAANLLSVFRPWRPSSKIEGWKYGFTEKLAALGHWDWPSELTVVVGRREDGQRHVRVRAEPFDVLEARARAGDRPALIWLDSHEDDAAVASGASLTALGCRTGQHSGFWWRSGPEPTKTEAASELCAGPLTGWSPVEHCGVGAKPGVCQTRSLRHWVLRVAENGKPDSLSSIGDDPVASDVVPGVQLGAEGEDPDSVVIGTAAVALSGGGLCTPGAGCAPPLPVEIREAGEKDPVALLAALPLRPGDVVALGSRAFLVHAALPLRPDFVSLSFLHARHPDSSSLLRSFLRSGSGAELYHPGRIESVPPCSQDKPLHILVPGPDSVRPSSDTLQLDAVRFANLQQEARSWKIDGARAEPGGGGAEPAHEMIACYEEAGDSSWQLRLESRRSTVGVCSDLTTCSSLADASTLPLGSEANPREILLAAGDTLLRIAPAAGRRAQQSAALGLWAFLAATLVLQAVPLTFARAAMGKELVRQAGFAEAFAWPTVLTPATLLQISGIAIAVLLYIGARYQMLLGVHPQLAGTPDYAQTFLFAAVLTSAIVTAAAWSAGGGPGSALWRVLAAAVVTSLLATLWWAVDSVWVPANLWLSAMRGNPPAGRTAALLAIAQTLTLAAIVVSLLRPRRRPQAAPGALGARLLRWLERHPIGVAAGFAALGFVAGLGRGSALVFQASLLAAIAWYAGHTWPTVSGIQSPKSETLESQAHRANRFSYFGVLLLAAFLILGSWLPLLASLGCLLAALALGFRGLALLWQKPRLRYSLYMGLAVAVALAAGILATIVFFKDFGSLSAWVPALFAGFFVWLLRPDEPLGFSDEERRLWAHGLLVLACGFSLLGVLDAADETIRWLDWSLLERPQQRFLLAREISYLLQGEWVARVRWLASGSDAAFQWVPNMNSDVAIFGVQANLGRPAALLSCLGLLLVAACAAVCSDQALRVARHVSEHQYRLAASLRALGIFLWAGAVLLLAQWLVHLSTGVVLHLPLTGLVFPWLSHGNTTHLLYAGALLLPMAAVAALLQRAVAMAGQRP